MLSRRHQNHMKYVSVSFDAAETGDFESTGSDRRSLDSVSGSHARASWNNLWACLQRIRGVLRSISLDYCPATNALADHRRYRPALHERRSAKPSGERAAASLRPGPRTPPPGRRGGYAWHSRRESWSSDTPAATVRVHSWLRR